MQFQHAQPPSVTAAAAESGPEAASGAPPPPGDEESNVAPFVRGERKVGRNEPCPCGSGRKYKHCHGALSGSG